MATATPTGNASGVTDIAMPKLSDSMEEGTVVRWLVPNGSVVTAGQEVVEVETDKATMAYETDVSGTLRRLVEEGETVRVGAPIAQVLAPGAEAVSESPTSPVPASSPEVSAGPRMRSGDVSSIARRMAGQLGVDLAQVVGTGPRGRIFKADVAAHHERQPVPEHDPGAQPTSAVAADHAELGVGDTGMPPGPGAAMDLGTAERDFEVTRTPLTRTQQLIARRMSESKATIPEFTLRMTIDMNACVQLRADFKAAGDEGGLVPSLNDLVIKAVALALREHPKLNSSYRDGQFEHHAHINVGVAVAAPDTLLVPTVRDADIKSVSQIANEMKRASRRAREGSLTAAELSGGTFTVSNLGMTGVDSFTAVINPPQAAILAVGQVSRQPVVEGEQVVIRSQMQVSLSCDHRIIYGADGAAFLSEVRRNLQAPLRMI